MRKVELSAVTRRLGTILGESSFATLSLETLNPPSQWDSTLVGKNLIPKEQILFFDSRSVIGRGPSSIMDFLAPYVFELVVT